MTVRFVACILIAASLLLVGASFVDGSPYSRPLLWLAALSFMFCGGLIFSLRRALGHAGILIREAERARRHAESMEQLHKSSEELCMRICDEWVTLTRLNLDRLDLEPVEIDVVTETCEELIDIDIEPPAARLPGLTLSIDKTRYRQVLRILASLAKHRGNARARIWRTANRFMVAITDSGAPIRAPIERLCRMGEEARLAGDLGVGLEVANRVLIAMRGELSLESDDRGNTFTVAIPIHD